MLLAGRGGWAAPAATPAPPGAATADAPQQTTATFGDWTLRCDRSAAAPVCEVVQSVANQGRTVAQIAVGRAVRGQPMHLSILVPPSANLGQPPQLVPSADKPQPLVELTWRRCLPGGCLADASLPDETLHRLRARTEPAELVFQDGTGRGVALPFSAHGLPQALDALGREDGG